MRKGKYHLIIVGTEPNDPLDYALDRKQNRLTVRMLGVMDSG